MLILASPFTDGRSCGGFVPGHQHARRALSLGRQQASETRSWLAAVAGGVVSLASLSAKLTRSCTPVAKNRLSLCRTGLRVRGLQPDGRHAMALDSSGVELNQKKQSKEAVKRAALQRLRDHAASKGGRCVSESYMNRMTKVEWECTIGHRWMARPNSVLNGGSWCPHCAINKNRLSLHQLQEHARKKGGRCLSDQYRNNRTRVRWQCKLRHTWEAEARAVLNLGSWCPKCARTTKSWSKRTLSDCRGMPPPVEVNAWLLNMAA